MAVSQITTPRGSIVRTGNGMAQLTWNPSFAGNRNQSFSRKQKVIDSEVLRRCAPRVPIDTSMLIKSGILGTVVGSGEVTYVAPYAKHQYYNTSETRSYDANRGAKWFERMKAAEKEDILKLAEREG